MEKAGGAAPASLPSHNYFLALQQAAPLVQQEEPLQQSAAKAPTDSVSIKAMAEMAEAIFFMEISPVICFESWQTIDSRGNAVWSYRKQKSGESIRSEEHG